MKFYPHADGMDPGGDYDAIYYGGLGGYDFDDLTAQYEAEWRAIVGNVSARRSESPAADPNQTSLGLGSDIMGTGTKDGKKEKKYSGKAATSVGCVMLTDEKGQDTDEVYYIPWKDRSWFDAAGAYYPVTPEVESFDGLDVMRVPASRCKPTYKAPPFNACVYTATEDYVQGRWGRKMHYTDKDWTAAHPLSKDTGVPVEYMPTVIQQLVEPYGLGVSRIRYRAGKLVVPDTILDWAAILGCNPLGLVDYRTPNAEAIAQYGLTLEQAAQLWRFEFHELPLRPAIVGETGWASSGSVQTGAGGGHSRYVAPRSTAGQWLIAIELDELSRLSYFAPVPNPEYKSRVGDATLYYSDIKNEKGDAVCVWKGTGYVLNDTSEVRYEVRTSSSSTARSWSGLESLAGSPSTLSLGQPTPPAPSTPTTTKTPTITLPVTVVEKDSSTFRCKLCESPKSFSQWVPGMDSVCKDCYRYKWSGYSCHSCGTFLTGVRLPKIVTRDDPTGTTIFECANPVCRAHIIVQDTDEGYKDLVGLAKHVSI